MLELGKYSTLNISRKTDHGVYLCNEEGNEVLLPNRYVPQDYQFQDLIEVFIYKDSEDRVVATTRKPYILLNEFAFLQVKDVNKTGAFLDWGLEKDLLVHSSEQNIEMQIGHSYVVYLYLDEMTERLAASAKLNRYFRKENIELIIGEKVNALVFAKTDLGFNVVINHLYKGLLYKNEVFKEINVGDQLLVWIKNIREDNKIDVSLQQPGTILIEPSATKILDYLAKHESKMQLTDKSSPEEIRQNFEMSKKNFKKAIGYLYKERLIKIEDEHICLVKNKS